MSFSGIKFICTLFHENWSIGSKGEILNFPPLFLKITEQMYESVLNTVVTFFVIFQGVWLQNFNSKAFSVHWPFTLHTSVATFSLLLAELQNIPQFLFNCGNEISFKSSKLFPHYPSYLGHCKQTHLITCLMWFVNTVPI